MYLTWIFILSFLGNIYGYPSGAPERACLAPVPRHNVDKNNNNPLYAPQSTQITGLKLTVSPATYTTGTSPEITITINATTAILGFIMVVQRKSGDMQQPMGHFTGCTGDQPVKNYTVYSSNANCITHANKNPKKEVTCKWMPPTTNEGILQVFLTVVRAHSTFWYGITERISIVNPVTFPPQVGAMTDPVTMPDCGNTKNCLVFPRSCQMSNTCFAMVRYWPVSVNNTPNVMIQVTAKNSEWIGVGISHDQRMDKSHLITCFQNPGASFDMDIAYTVNHTSNLVINSDVSQRTGVKSVDLDGSRLSCSFCVPANFPTQSNIAFNLETEKVFIFLGQGPMIPGTRGYQQHSRRPLISSEAVNLRATNYKIYSMDGLSTAVKVHGTLMTLAWLFLSSIGVLISRHYRGNLTKQFKGTALWFWFHILCVVVAVLLGIAGFIYILAVNNGWINKQTKTQHGAVGIVGLALALINVGAGVCRPNPTAAKRYIFDWFHFFCGMLTRIFVIASFWLATQIYDLNANFEYLGIIVVATWTAIEVFFFFVFLIRKKIAYREYDREFEYRSKYGFQGMKKSPAGVRHIGYKSFLFYTFLIVGLTVALITGLWIY